jgi:hypothetical protein
LYNLVSLSPKEPIQTSITTTGPCSSSDTLEPIQRLGPERGYFPEPAKSIFICSPEDRPGAEELLEAFSFKFTDGYRYVGGFLGSDAALLQWLAPQIQQWVSGVASLAKVAKRYPQIAYQPGPFYSILLST